MKLLHLHEDADYSSIKIETKELELLLYRVGFEYYRPSGSSAEFNDFIQLFGLYTMSPSFFFGRYSAISNPVRDLFKRLNYGNSYFFLNYCNSITNVFRGRHVSSLTPYEMQVVPFVGPRIARQFYIRTRPQNDPLAQQLVDLDRRHRDQLRNAGGFLPRRPNVDEYRCAELMYLKLLKNIEFKA